jgi:hypothetical protein
VSESSVDDAIRKVMDRELRRHGEACPSADLMAAYLEARLSPTERAAFEAHASSCSCCQQALALCVSDAESPPCERPAAAGDRIFFRRAWAVSLLTSAAVLVFLALAVWRDSANRPQGKVSEVAENRAPRPRPYTGAGRTAGPPAGGDAALAPAKSGEIRSQREPSTTESKQAAGGSVEEKAEAQTPPPASLDDRAAETPAAADESRRADAPMAAQSAANPQREIRLEADAIQIGGKTFVKREDRWIDADFPPRAEPLRVSRASAEFQALLRVFPELGRLAAEGIPVLIRLQGKNYQID